MTDCQRTGEQPINSPLDRAWTNRAGKRESGRRRHAGSRSSLKNLTRSRFIMARASFGHYNQAFWGGLMGRRLAHVRLRAIAACLTLAFVSVSASGGRDAIKSQDLKEWLTYIASDD